MSETATTKTTSAPQTDVLDPRIAWSFLRFSGGWWTGGTAGSAWWLTIALGVCLALSTAMTVAVNSWNRWFFDALEKKDVAAVWQAVGAIAIIVAIMAAIGVGIVLARETLQIRWRGWLIDRLVERWLGDRRFYHLNASRTEPANPEYRIADDTRWATEPLTDMGIGLVLAVLNATAFISILWSVGGSYTWNFGSGSVTIPAYMVLVALGYGGLMSGLMLWIGKPLPQLVYGKNEREGDFRFALMRLRENAESVALMSGHGRERAVLGAMFANVVGAWLQIVKRHGHLTWVTNAAGPLIPIVPLIFAAPKYLSGDLTLGQVTQLAGAFIAVQGAISWVVDNFNRLAEWYASARRVMDIVEACEAAEAAASAGSIASGPVHGAGRITYRQNSDGQLAASGLTVRDPFGSAILESIDLTISEGGSVHVLGDTSAGKTTLVRALAGLWTNGEGVVSLPRPRATEPPLLVVPQKQYLPLGSLLHAIVYPRDEATLAGREAVTRALSRIGLGHLVPHLDETARWDQRLSNGERQRLAVARVMLDAPRVVILDDAIAALDEASQVDMHKAIREWAPDAIILSLGQTAPPPGLHDRVLAIVRRGETTTLADPELAEEPAAAEAI